MINGLFLSETCVKFCHKHIRYHCIMKCNHAGMYKCLCVCMLAEVCFVLCFVLQFGEIAHKRVCSYMYRNAYVDTLACTIACVRACTHTHVIMHQKSCSYAALPVLEAIWLIGPFCANNNSLQKSPAKNFTVQNHKERTSYQF